MRELAMCVIALAMVVSGIATVLMIRMIGKINDRLPPNERIIIPFAGLNPKALRDRYAAMYPEGDLHLRVWKLSRFAVITQLLGLALLLVSLWRLDHPQ